MKNLKYLIILNGILNYVQLIHAAELIELSCFNENQCKQFQHSGIKSSCIDEQCLCSADNEESIECQPWSPTVNNIIGGPCECKQDHAECDALQNVCYCVKNFMPSRDKRRCIPRMVALDGKCERDSQCHNVDFNAVCHESKICKCMDHFVNIKGQCVSLLGNKSSYLNDTECLNQYGNHTEYNQQSQQCICKTGHFASGDKSRCLKTAKYLENCIENLQCIGTMGPGGICTENVCQCSTKYFVEEKASERGTMETVCRAVIERGHYCRYQEDCYQRQLSETEQSMDCVFGECDCRKGFYSHNNVDCTEGSGAGIKLMGLQSFIGLWTFLKILNMIFIN